MLLPNCCFPFIQCGTFEGIVPLTKIGPSHSDSAMKTISTDLEVVFQVIPSSVNLIINTNKHTSLQRMTKENYTWIFFSHML